MNRLPVCSIILPISLMLPSCILSKYDEGSLGSSVGGAPPNAGGGNHSGGTSSGSKGGSVSGGASLVGGASTSGGTKGNGGSSAAAGSSVTGGSKSAGGSASTGGMQSNGGTANASGGQPSGGASPSSGGSFSTGGVAAAGGLSSIGGAKATGGTIATGGTRQTGGSVATGGSSQTGGSFGAGGTSATGGKLATGGTAATGGSPVTGGSPPIGGAPPTGGAPATGGTCNGTGGGSSLLVNCDGNTPPCAVGWYSSVPAMVSADVSQPYFQWHLQPGTMLGFPILLKAGYSVQSLGVVTSLPPQGTFRLALYRNGSDPSAPPPPPSPTPIAPGSKVAETDDIQSAGGDNICTNVAVVTANLAGGFKYAVTANAFFWVTLLVKGTNDVVIVGLNSASTEPTWCASPITPLSFPDLAPTSLQDCAPPGRTTSAGTWQGAVPYLFAVMSP
jgi:hypothetical protein